MNHAASPCDDTRLRALLDSDDQDTTLEGVVVHLETCARCRSRLGELAAGREEWEQVRRSLVLCDADSEFEREREERSWNVFACQSSRARSDWSDSMARQLLSPPSHPEMLGRLGRYEIERLIGAGGMGVVFKGFDSELNRPVAIKVLAPHLTNSGAARKRFAREARAAAAVVHEHVVAIHNVESETDPPFLVMQYVAGGSLQSKLDHGGPLSLCEVLRIARQTAAGLAAAHEQGLVHRDVKPSNILLEEGVDRALLTDFGLARASDDASLTRSGHLPGTPHYMSPEQARGERADQRSDLFSLGSAMYAMCTGRPPFRAETSFGVLRRITDAHPRPIQEINPEIPQWLCWVIDKLQAETPGDRYESAADVAELLGQCLAHVQQPDVQPLPVRVANAALRASAVSHARVRWTSLWQATLRNPRIILVGLGTLAALFTLLKIAPPARENGNRRTNVTYQALTAESTSHGEQTDASYTTASNHRQTNFTTVPIRLEILALDKNGELVITDENGERVYKNGKPYVGTRDTPTAAGTSSPGLVLAEGAEFAVIHVVGALDACVTEVGMERFASREESKSPVVCVLNSEEVRRCFKDEVLCYLSGDHSKTYVVIVGDRRSALDRWLSQPRNAIDQVILDQFEQWRGEAGHDDETGELFLKFIMGQRRDGQPASDFNRLPR